MVERIVFNPPVTIGGGLEVARRGIVFAGLAFILGSATSTCSVWARPFDGTSGAPPAVAPGLGRKATAERTAAKRLGDAKRLSGLTWEELSRAMDTTRRTLHLWANGRAISSANEGRLSRLVGVLQVISRGTGRETRQALLTPSEDDGLVPLDLLVLGRFDEVAKRLDRGRPVPTRRIASKAGVSSSSPRRPPSPVALLDAMQDPIGTTQLGPLPGKVVRRPTRA